MTVSDERLRDLRQWVVKCMNEYTDDDYDDTLAIFDELLALRAASREAALKALTEQAQELGLGYTPQASPAKCEKCGDSGQVHKPHTVATLMPCPDCESRSTREQIDLAIMWLRGPRVINTDSDLASWMLAFEAIQARRSQQGASEAELEAQAWLSAHPSEPKGDAK